MLFHISWEDKEKIIDTNFSHETKELVELVRKEHKEGRFREFNYLVNLLDMANSAVNKGNNYMVIGFGEGENITDKIRVVHGAPPCDTETYITGDNFKLFLGKTSEQITLYGHTHIPTVIAGDMADIADESLSPFYHSYRSFSYQYIDPREHGNVFELEIVPSKRYLINPGSVGFPRDGNPQAAYGIIEKTQEGIKIQIRRVPYDIEKHLSQFNEYERRIITILSDKKIKNSLNFSTSSSSYNAYCGYIKLLVAKDIDVANEVKSIIERTKQVYQY